MSDNCNGRGQVEGLLGSRSVTLGTLTQWQCFGNGERGDH